jgi:hypothetical protein
MEKPSLEWTVGPPPTSPVKLGAVLAAIVLVLVAGAVGAKSLLLGLAGAVAIVHSVQEAFLPIRYRLDEKGASARCGIGGSSMLWPDVRRTIPSAVGIRLSPFSEPSRRDGTRGVLLKFSSNEEAVWATIRELWQSDESGLVGAPGGGEGEGGDREDRVLDQEQGNGGSGSDGA